MHLKDESIVSQTPGVLSTTLDSDLILLNPKSDRYVGLDEIGRHIWDLLAEPMAVKDLVGRVTREYEGNPVEMTRDIFAFMGELDDAGLIRQGDAGT